MIYRQGGPYTQHKLPYVGIHFNDPVLHYVAAVKSEHTADFRFGFYLRRMFDRLINQWIISAGFYIANPTLCLRFFMPNLQVHRVEVSKKLAAWALRHQDRYAFTRFGESDSSGRALDGDDNLESFATAISIYAGLGRKKTKLGWNYMTFYTMRDLSEFNDQSEEYLHKNSDAVAVSALAVFEELGFLYRLLFPSDLGPARTGSGQNRALKSKQPDRTCSWLTDESCRGIVQAAHIKPDYMGGLAVPGNLIWLCEFHHTLLDVYLRASMRKVLSSKTIVASISDDPPSGSVGNGIPLSIWNQIELRGEWPLPLRTESIGHLFE
jgi:hypothetical protein